MKSLLLAILIYLTSTISAWAEEKVDLTIGFVLPLSGDLAFLGNGIRDGALLAQKDLALQGVRANLLFGDNGGKLAESATIANRFISNKQLDAMISIISGVGQILKPLAQRAKVINIGICSEPEVADGNYSFINYLTAEQGVAKFLQHFKATFGPGRSLGIFAQNESGFLRITKELRKQPSDQIKVLFEENFNKGTVDFKTLVLRKRGFKADAYLLLGLSPEIELLARQTRALGIKTPFVSIESFGLVPDRSPFEGNWFVDSAVPSAKFRQRFADTYRREVTPGVGHAYDTVMLLGAAALAQRDQPDTLVSHFKKIKDYSGVIGPLTVGSDGVIWSEASIKTITAGEAVLVE